MSTAELAEACEATEAEVDRALDLLGASLAERGVVLREVAGGHTLAAHPDAGDAARRLLARPKTPPLTQAQAETLAIIAYLQPVSRPEIARIRGVSSESARADADRARPDRGVRPLALRRRDPPHDAAVRAPLRPLRASTRCPTRRASTRRPRTRPSCASAC